MPRKTALRTIATLACAGLLLPAGLGAGIATGRILGTVSDAGKRPLQGAQVRLTSRSEAGLLRITSTDEKGDYRFKDLPPGIYDVLIEVEGCRPALKENVEVRPPFQNIVDVQVAREGAAAAEAGAAGAAPAGAATGGDAAASAPPAPVSVQGRLSDAAKHPVVDVTVLLVAHEGDRLYQASSGTDGSFVIESVIPGRYRAIIRSPGHVPVDLKSVEVLPESGLNVTLALVDFPLNFKTRPEGSPPPETPRPLPAPPAAPAPAMTTP